MRSLVTTALLATFACSLAAETYVIDPVHSTAIWGIQHLGLGNTYGRFNDISGSIVFDENDLAGSSVSITIPVASIDSANKKRDDHLRNADFFDAGTHPEMTFTGEGFTAVAGKENVYLVPGELTIRGTTKPVELEVALLGQGRHAMAKKPAIGFESEFTLDRTEYGVGQGDISNAVGKDVRVILAVEGIAE
jgi:polyisoprenoid-binding protein YceI